MPVGETVSNLIPDSCGGFRKEGVPFGGPFEGILVYLGYQEVPRFWEMPMWVVFLSKESLPLRPRPQRTRPAGTVNTPHFFSQ